MSDDLNYPNIWGRSILTSAEEILGERGVNALLNLVGLQQYIGNYPPDNIKKDFPFEHVSKIQQGFWEMYGPKGARIFATKGGVTTFNHSLSKFDKVQKAAQMAMSFGSTQVRMKAGLLFFAKFFNTVSDQVVRIEEDENTWKWIIEVCPVCWGRETTEPCCHLAIGVLKAAADWATGGESFLIKETECIAKGDPECVIIIEKTPL